MKMFNDLTLVGKKWDKKKDGTPFISLSFSDGEDNVKCRFNNPLCSDEVAFFNSIELYKPYRITFEYNYKYDMLNCSSVDPVSK